MLCAAQIVSRETTNVRPPTFCFSRLRECPDDASPLLSQLTPAQLEEFESTFRHFDVDGNNTLAIEEFEAALAALSISFSVRPSFLINPNSVEKLNCLRTPSRQTAEIDNIFDELVETFGALNFKAFTSFLVEIIQDTDSPQQLQNAFREIAGNKVRRRRSLCKSRVEDCTLSFFLSKTALRDRAGSSGSASAQVFHRILQVRLPVPSYNLVLLSSGPDLCFVSQVRRCQHRA